jgi:hypothetical protein
MNQSWKKNMLEHWVLKSDERVLLKGGPKSLAQAWRLQALKYRYDSYYPDK